MMVRKRIAKIPKTMGPRRSSRRCRRYELNGEIREIGADPVTIGVLPHHGNKSCRHAQTRQADRNVERGATHELTHATRIAQLIDEGIADDNDPSTTFTWKRVLAAQSTATITWSIPTGTPSGTYRIVHRGAAKSALGRITQFTGTTRTFTVG